MGLIDIIKKMKTIKNGLVLVTGRVNSGKSTTMNGFIQEVNKTEKKKIVTLEDPIEYEMKGINQVLVEGYWPIERYRSCGYSRALA